jgi:hypothetical protein
LDHHWHIEAGSVGRSPHTSFQLYEELEVEFVDLQDVDLDAVAEPIPDANHQEHHMEAVIPHDSLQTMLSLAMVVEPTNANHQGEHHMETVVVNELIPQDNLSEGHHMEVVAVDSIPLANNPQSEMPHAEMVTEATPFVTGMFVKVCVPSTRRNTGGRLYIAEVLQVADELEVVFLRQIKTGLIFHYCKNDVAFVKYSQVHLLRDQPVVSDDKSGNMCVRFSNNPLLPST